MKKFNIALNEEQVNKILQALGNGPYIEVADLIDYIRVQAVSQMEKTNEQSNVTELETESSKVAKLDDEDTQSEINQSTRTKIGPAKFKNRKVAKEA